MKSVHQSLKKWMRDHKSFQMNYQNMRRQILQDQAVASFLQAHPQLSEAEINKNLMKLYEYATQSKQCENCQSLEACRNILPGYTPVISVENNDIHLAYTKCQAKLDFEKRRKTENLIQNFYMPKTILEARFADLHSDPERSLAIRETVKFLEEAKTKLPEKGLYFYGPFGVGKTYFLGAIANELKKYRISSIIIYMPEFVRDMRNAIKDDTLNDKIDFFKTADVLMFDDIGAETQSAWFRDEVLGTILQYRMMERLPVFFTSNFSLEQLETQISETAKGGIEEVKAGRIMERIKQVSKEVPIFGHNYREKQEPDT